MTTLPMCKATFKYKTLFITVERDRDRPKQEQREKLMTTIKKAPFAKHVNMAITSEEVSENDYYHHHLIMVMDKERRVMAMQKYIQDKMHFKKTNNAKISVWFGYLPQGSTGNASTLKQYLDEKKYKTSEPDPEGSITFIDRNTCDFCGTSEKYETTNNFGEIVQKFKCSLHPKHGGKICAFHPRPAMCMF